MQWVPAPPAVCLSLTVMASHAAAAGTPAAPVGAAPTPAAGNPLAAVWKEQRIDFLYLGRTARYSCEGLRDKVRAMLLDLGARRDLKVTALGCEDTGRAGVNSIASSLSIVFSAPALADPADKPSHEGDLAATDARFEPFTIAGDAFRNMGVGDCELVEEFTHQILPKLVTRDLKRDIACVPHQQSGSRFLVKGEILRSLPGPGLKAP
ncbi:MAG: hypothetical protein M3O41_18980 [Pseudomonadota bacterium]|nr:hypothetical protein [Pseudomonadota bacterium]